MSADRQRYPVRKYPALASQWRSPLFFIFFPFCPCNVSQGSSSAPALTFQSLPVQCVSLSPRRNHIAELARELLNVLPFLMGLQRPYRAHAQTHRDGASNNGTWDVCACVCVWVRVCVLVRGRIAEGHRGSIVFRLEGRSVGRGRWESQGEAKFRAPPLNYSKYSYGQFRRSRIHTPFAIAFPRVMSPHSHVIEGD